MLSIKHTLFRPRCRPLGPSLLLLLALLGSVSALAAGLTLEQAVERVRRDTGGRVLAAETVQEDGRRVHRIKVLTPERNVRTVRVDAGNGR